MYIFYNLKKIIIWFEKGIVFFWNVKNVDVYIVLCRFYNSVNTVEIVLKRSGFFLNLCIRKYIFL